MDRFRQAADQAAFAGCEYKSRCADLMDLAANSYSAEDLQRARSVYDLAGHIEALYRQTLDLLPFHIMRGSRHNAHYAYLTRVVRPMERIGDRALSIAETVLEMQGDHVVSWLAGRNLDLAA